MLSSLIKRAARVAHLFVVLNTSAVLGLGMALSRRRVW